MEMVRFGVSMSPKLLERFDESIAKKGYANRSEAIRDLIRESLVEMEWETGDEEVVGTITIIYSHTTRELADKLTDFQHQAHQAIISTLHVHLDEHNCLEVMVVRGKSKLIREISERLISTKGVKHGKLTMTSVGDKLA
jgi:CopG family nickel-responsive transcriptional regulator